MTSCIERVPNEVASGGSATTPPPELEALLNALAQSDDVEGALAQLRTEALNAGQPEAEVDAVIEGIRVALAARQSEP